MCKQCGKKFRPVIKTQEDCSEQCLANRFDTRVRKTRKLAKIFAATMGYRSMSEVRFAARLNANRIFFEYEGYNFLYQHEPQKYTVDFTVKTSNGKLIHFEYKGKLDNKERRKLKAIKKSNPTMDLRLVFEKPNNKLFKGARTRYWEWAVRSGFPWYAADDVKKIKSDISGSGKLKKDAS